jgi:hypothetical protein
MVNRQEDPTARVAWHAKLTDHKVEFDFPLVRKP